MRCNSSLGLALILIATGGLRLPAQTPANCALPNGVALDPQVLAGTVPGGSSNVNTSKLLTVMNQGSPDFVVMAAHRGDWYACAENTPGSLQQTMTEGIEAIEVDARFSMDGTLVVSHDSDLLKETNWNVSQNGIGLVSQTNWSQIQNLQVRDRRGNVQSGSQMMTLQQVLQLLQANSHNGMGPVLLVDLKDPATDPTGQGHTLWNAYLNGVSLVAQTLDAATQPAVLFKIGIQNLPMTGASTVQTQCDAHPNYGHIVAVVYSQAANDPNWNSGSSNFQTLVNLSRSQASCDGGSGGAATKSFIQQFEVNIKNFSDPAASYIPVVNSFSVFDQFYFYPEGVATIYGGPTDSRVFNPNPPPQGLLQSQTFCCFEQDLASGTNQDLRGIVDFAFHYNQANGGVSLVTSDNLALTLSYLVSVGKRNVSEIQ